tara:strand:- start:2050 stop:3243 length:1194 start_codon:yes stop_codon:yes gene_type:complete
MSVGHQPWAAGAVGHMDHELFGNVWIKDTKGLDFKTYDLAGKYCNKLFTWLEVDMHGRCWMCCPSWLPYPIGNILEEDIEDIWNGPKAQELRKQIFTGEWNYCQTAFCPLIQGESLRDIKDLLAGHTLLEHEREALITKSLVSKELPIYINFSNDESCNLRCPSCRTTKLLYTEGPMYDKRKAINDRIVEAFLTTPTDRKFGIFVTGSGDPWASKIFRDMLYNINGEDFPNLRVSMQTNGVMYTPKLWKRIHKIHNNLGDCRISFDAATKETYEGKTRLNGDWELLLNNCKHLDSKRLEFPDFRIFYDYVVQHDNYKEMKAYVELIYDMYPNRQEICFSMVSDWGTWSPEMYNQKCIWKADHPEHQEFLECLKDPIFDRKDIRLGNLSSMRKKALGK